MHSLQDYDSRGNRLSATKQNGVVSSYSYDPHGSVVSYGNTAYQYDAFGNQLTDNNTTNPFRYCGEYFDEETGFVYLRNRYYDTTTGRFITEDPVKDGLNWYVYCSNNPVMFVDPLGLKAKGEIITYNSGSSSDVVLIQSKLNLLGYKGKDGLPLAMDGVFGENTEYAVKQYQRNKGLTADGIVGDKTWSKMGFGYSSRKSSEIILPVKIDPNNWEEYHDNDDTYKKDTSLRGKDARKREQEQINSAFGKNRAERERQSRDLHDSKKGKRNDDNSSYGQLKNDGYWGEAISVGAVVIGGTLFILSGGIYLPAY